jgi:hypothetical protein
LALACAVSLMWTGAAHAQKPEGCRYITSTPISAEGFDGPDTFGVRIALPMGAWIWGPAHGGMIAGCPSCEPPKISKGILRIGLAPFYAPSDDYQLRRETGQQDASPVEFALHPSAIAVGMRVLTNFTPRAIVPTSDITPIKLMKTDGMARAIRIDSSGNPVHGLALAMLDRCFALFAMFFREDNAPLEVSELQQMDDVLKLDKYTPRFNIEQLTPRRPPPPRIDFPLGDARKQWEDEQKRGQ